MSAPYGKVAQVLKYAREGFEHTSVPRLEEAVTALLDVLYAPHSTSL
jgi:hypothetical protein